MCVYRDDQSSGLGMLCNMTLAASKPLLVLYYTLVGLREVAPVVRCGFINGWELYELLVIEWYGL